MKLINNRYKVVEQINQDKVMPIYIVEDLWNLNKQAQLILLNGKGVTRELIDYYTEEFIRLKNIDTRNIMKDFHFNRLTHIDNRKNNEMGYYLVSEYNNTFRNIGEYLDELDFTQIIDLFVSVCHVINSLHSKGMVYGNIAMGNIFYERKSKEIRLTSLANVRLQNQYRPTVEQSFLSAYVTDTQVHFARGLRMDLYDLGLLLLKLVKGTEEGFNPIQDLEQLDTEKDPNIMKITPIIRDLLADKEEGVFKHVSEIIHALNKSLQTNYPIHGEKTKGTLYFDTKIINQQTIIQAIEKSVKQVENYEKTKNVFLINGSTGTGKTRLLEELEFKFKIQGLDTYTTFVMPSTLGNSQQFLLSLFHKLMRDSDVEVYEKYENDLKTYFPELREQTDIEMRKALSELTKYQLSERVLAFVRESIRNRHLMFLVDNIHLASKSTLKILSQIISIVKDEKAVLVLTYNDEKIVHPVEFNSIVDELTEQSGIHYFTMETLNQEETGRLIKNILSTSETPEPITKQLFTLSNGNPAFITEMVKDLYNRKVIYTASESGPWKINFQDDMKSLEEAVPLTMEEILLNQIDSLDETTLIDLKKMSIISTAKTFEFWQEYLCMTKEELDGLLNKLTSLGMLLVTYHETITLYGISNVKLQNIVENKLTKDEKIAYHGHAASVIEKRLTEESLDELIYHFEHANNIEKVKEYCLADVENLKKFHDWPTVFKQLLKALSYEEDVEKRIEINMKIGQGYLARDEKDEAYIYFKNAEKLLATDEINENRIDIYLNLAELEVHLLNSEAAASYFEKIERLLSQYTYNAGEIEYRLLKVKKLKHDGVVDGVIDLCLTLLADLAVDPVAYEETIAQVKYFLADAYIQSGNETEKAIQLYEEATIVFEEKGLIKEQIYTLNNLAGIYLERLHEYDIALDKFTELYEFSKMHDFPPGHVLSLINIGSIYGSKGEIYKSYETFKNALDEIKDAPAIRNQLPFIYMNIIRMGLNLHLYKEANHYMELFQQEFKDNTYPEHEEVQMNLASSFVYYALGVYDQSDKANDKVLDSYLDSNHPLRGYQYARKLMYEVRTKTPAEYETAILEIYDLVKRYSSPQYCIIILLDFALVLHEVGDLKNVSRLNKEIEKLITEIEEPNLRIYTRYHYLRGVVAKDDTWEETLLLSLRFAKDELEFSTRIMIQLAERYLQAGNLYLAANYYLETGFIFQRLLNQVSDEYKINYVHAHLCAITFRRIEMLKQVIIHGKNLDQVNTVMTNKVNTVEEVKEMMENFDVEIFTKNKDFMSKMKKEYKNIAVVKHYPLDTIIANLSNDTPESIEMLLSHLLVKTVANNAVVYTETMQDTFEVLSSLGEEATAINTQPFKRVKTTLEPVTELVEQTDYNLIVHKVKQAIYVPIFENNFYFDRDNETENGIKKTSRYNIIGYLYIDSEKVVNNLTIESINAEVGLLNLIALLIERQQLKVAASIDKVTGALTRKYLEDSITEHFNRKRYYNEPFSLLLFDLDRFKRINDTYGHQVGDKVLRNLSELVMEYVGSNGILGRFGGEEFIVILPKTRLPKAMEWAEELRTLISETRLLSDDTIVTVSLGVVSSDQGNTIDILIQKADQALYAAKEAGRNKALSWDSKYTNIVQKKKQAEFTSGDEVQDSRNVLALVELLQLVNKNAPIEQKRSEYLQRIMETVNAQSVHLIKIKDGSVSEQWTENIYQEKNKQVINYDRRLLETTILNQEARFSIRLDNADMTDFQSNVPNLQSNLAVPIMFQDDLIGVIYLIASARIKEFSEKDVHIVSVFSDIAAIILRDS